MIHRLAEIRKITLRRVGKSARHHISCGPEMGRTQAMNPEAMDPAISRQAEPGAHEPGLQAQQLNLWRNVRRIIKKRLQSRRQDDVVLENEAALVP